MPRLSDSVAPDAGNFGVAVDELADLLASIVDTSSAAQPNGAARSSITKHASQASWFQYPRVEVVDIVEVFWELQHCAQRIAK
jgi:hypothetical protein